MPPVAFLVFLGQFFEILPLMVPSSLALRSVSSWSAYVVPLLAYSSTLATCSLFNRLPMASLCPFLMNSGS